MKEIAVLLLFFTISSIVKEIHGAKVYGAFTSRHANLTDMLWKIWLKGSRELFPNKMPDLTFNDKQKQRWAGAYAYTGRRSIKNILASQRKHTQRNVNKELLANEYGTVLTQDNPEIDHASRKDVENLILRLGLRSRRQEDKKVDDEVLLKSQHGRKIKEIKKFLDKNHFSTDYIYCELQRIKRDHVIKEPLRRMVDYLSQPNREDLVKSVFKCFKERRKIDAPPKNIWNNRDTNNLVINVVKNPVNYGFIN